MYNYANSRHVVQIVDNFVENFFAMYVWCIGKILIFAL